VIQNKNEIHSLNSHFNTYNEKNDGLYFIENMHMRKQKLFLETKKEGREINNDIDPSFLLTQPEDLDIVISDDVNIWKCITN
jgi:hypothetical protein